MNRYQSVDLVLTARELEVLAMMATGAANHSIAESLYISRKSVEKHVNSIFSKLHLTGHGTLHPRVRAVLIYLRDMPEQRIPELQAA